MPRSLLFLVLVHLVIATKRLPAEDVPPGPALLETGRLLVTTDPDTWRRVDFSGNFEDPVVILGPYSRSNEAVSPRVKAVDADGFLLRHEPFSREPISDGEVHMSWLAVEAGRHDLPMGRSLEAGHADNRGGAGPGPSVPAW